MTTSLDVSRLIDSLTEMRKIFEACDEPTWVRALTTLIHQFTTTSHDKWSEVARAGLKLYGGMGSLSDVVLYQNGRVAMALNDRLEVLRQETHQMLVSLIK